MPKDTAEVPNDKPVPSGREPALRPSKAAKPEESRDTEP